MKTYSSTDVGMTRTENQDCVYTSEMPVGNLSNLFLVADGMGGHNAGKYASECAVDDIRQWIEKEASDKPFEIFEKAIQNANSQILAKGRESLEMQGMGTTVVAAVIEGNRLYVANVGDSRLYLVSPGAIRQVTKDHSLVEEMVRLGEIDRVKAKEHPDKNIITRTVGASSELKIDYFEETIREDEVVLICTDGLTNMVEDAQIKTIINSGRDVVERVEELVNAANSNGGKDNITVVVIEP